MGFPMKTAAPDRRRAKRTSTEGETPRSGNERLAPFGIAGAPVYTENGRLPTFSLACKLDAPPRDRRFSTIGRMSPISLNLNHWDDSNTSILLVSRFTFRASPRSRTDVALLRGPLPTRENPDVRPNRSISSAGGFQRLHRRISLNHYQHGRIAHAISTFPCHPR